MYAGVQVLLRWALQMGFAVIPKTTNVDRVMENAGIFDFVLSERTMKLLGTMQGWLGEYWNPLEARLDAADHRGCFTAH